VTDGVNQQYEDLM